MSDSRDEDVTAPAKLLRVADMTRQVFEEIQHADLDRAARMRVEASQRVTLDELRDLLPSHNQEELDTLRAPFAEVADGSEDGEPASEPRLRLAEAQLLGWLEGLLKGIQAETTAKQVQAEMDQVSQVKQAQQQQDQALRAPGSAPGYH